MPRPRCSRTWWPRKWTASSCCRSTRRRWFRPSTPSSRAALPSSPRSSTRQHPKRAFFYLRWGQHGRPGQALGRARVQATLRGRRDRHHQLRHHVLLPDRHRPAGPDERFRVSRRRAQRGQPVPAVPDRASTTRPPTRPRTSPTSRTSTRPRQARSGSRTRCAARTRMNWGKVLKQNDDHSILVAGYDWLPDTLDLIEEGWVGWAQGSSVYQEGNHTAKVLFDSPRQRHAAADGCPERRSGLGRQVQPRRGPQEPGRDDGRRLSPRQPVLDGPLAVSRWTR